MFGPGYGIHLHWFLIIASSSALGKANDNLLKNNRIRFPRLDIYFRRTLFLCYLFIVRGTIHNTISDRIASYMCILAFT